MKRHFKKLVAAMMLVSMFVFDLMPLDGIFSSLISQGNNSESGLELVTANAAMDSDFQFSVGGALVESGEELEYGKAFREGQDIALVANVPVPAGSTFTWRCDDVNVIAIKDVLNGGTSVELDVKSPGYAGLYCYIKDPQGNVVANPYCVVHIPLEWDDLTAADIRVNTSAGSTHPKYGLLWALSTDSADNSDNYTLQLYADSSDKYKDYSHYLRKVRRITYTKADGSTDVRGDIKEEELGEITTALDWSSSDTTVAEVDPKTGYITAKGAGFARITARTATSNVTTGETDSISMDVVVVPEATIIGHTTEQSPEFGATVRDNEIIIQSNARFADALDWEIYRDETMATELTSTYRNNMSVSNVSGRVVLTGLPAGKYFITAIPVKDRTPTYTTKTANIEKLELSLLVPLTFPESPIIMNYYNENMKDVYDIFENSNLPVGMFRFSTDTPRVASVTSSGGVIQAENRGSAKISIFPLENTLKEIFGNYTNLTDIGYDSNDSTIALDVEVIEGIALSATDETMALGATLQLLMTSPSPYDGEVIWSSNDESIVTVNQDGLVTAVGVGDAAVTARIKINGVTKRARCRIKVITSVNSIVLNARNDYVEVGDNLTISATITPRVNNAELIWSCSDESIASVASTSPLSMTITGVKAGRVIITAINSDNAVVGTMAINVIQKIEKITISDTEVTLPLTAGFYQLYATCTPELPSSQGLTWTSSDTGVATVDGNGKVTLKKAGKSVISVVTENGLMAQCNLTVLQGVSSIKLDKTELDLAVGEGERLTYVVSPATASEPSLRWSSTNTKIATVDSTGYVTGKNIGQCVVTAQSTDGSGIFVMCTVTVTQAAKSIKIDVTELVLNVSETYTLEVELSPAGCTDTVTFESSNKKIATVNKKGKIQGKAKGTTVIMARTSTGIIAYCNVTVVQQVTGLTLNETEASIMVGDELELEATLSPKNVSDPEVSWTTSNRNIATVNDRGEVEGISGGVAIITCTSEDGGYSAVCVVTVEELVRDIVIDPDYVEVGVGKKLALNVTIGGETATNKNVTFESSSTRICRVSDRGVITGVRVGTTQITVTATDGSGVTAICDVRVINATDQIEVDPTYIRLVQGESETITATIYPSNATYTPLFTSDNEAVAIVNKKGVVTGIKPGSAIITAVAEDDESVRAVTYVEVIAPVNATSVTFAEEEVIMVPGETKTVPYSIVPSNITESFTWSSDNPAVVTVDEYSGRITARDVGAATVTLMTQSGKRGTVRVFVVGLSRDNVQLYQYERLKIKLEVDGTGSENLTVRWDTDNQNIAEVSGGTITGKALGTTRVYAVVNGRRLACTVKVIKNK